MEVGRMLKLTQSAKQAPTIIRQYLPSAIEDLVIKTKLLQSVIRNRAAHGIDAKRIN